MEYVKRILAGAKLLKVVELYISIRNGMHKFELMLDFMCNQIRFRFENMFRI